MEGIKLSQVILIWEELHAKDTGALGYCDLEKAIEKVVGIEDDIISMFTKKSLT